MSNFIEVETFTANNSSYTVLANDCFILIITTDNSSCLIDSSASVQININFGSLQVISVPNGSYITI